MIGRRFALRWGCLAVWACTPASNLPPDGGVALADAGPEPEFIALQADLEGYRSWETFTIPSGETGQGTRWIYLNHRPSQGSSEWPVGTILVKELYTLGLHPTLQIDAMVKRGGKFNDADGGARGWEWMGLSKVGDAGATIFWRGTEPPPGAGYVGPTAGCNQCHAGFPSTNDSVKLPPDDAGLEAAFGLALENYR